MIEAERLEPSPPVERDRTDLPFDVHSFVQQPLLPASVSTVGVKGGPVLATMWYLFAVGRFWLSTQAESFIQAARSGQDVAVMVETFEPPDRILVVRTTGTGRIEEHDPARVEAIYRRYLGPDLSVWPSDFRERLHDREFKLLTVRPERGTIAAFPNFETREVRWQSLGECPLR